jgi:hypothetical protein
MRRLAAGRLSGMSDRIIQAAMVFAALTVLLLFRGLVLQAAQRSKWFRLVGSAALLFIFVAMLVAAIASFFIA